VLTTLLVPAQAPTLCWISFMTMGSAGRIVSPHIPFIGPTCFTNIWSALELVNSVKLSVRCYSYTQAHSKSGHLLGARLHCRHTIFLAYKYWDEILGHQLEKKLESFAPCYSQSFLLAAFTENHALLWFLKSIQEKSAKQENSSLFMNSIL
jgi:hypothetical protein